MKSKLLTLLILVLSSIVAISIGYDTIFRSSDGITEIKNIAIKEYSGNQLVNSYLGSMPTLSAIKGYLLSWYTAPPTEVLNQYQTNTLPSDYSTAAYIAQTFQIDGGGTLTKIEFYRKYSNSFTGVIEIRTTSGGTPTSTILASEQISASTAGWITVTFSNPPQVDDGVTYALVIKRSNGYSYWAHYNGDAYTKGKALTSGDGSSWSALASNEDMAFKVYTVGTALDQYSTSKSTYSVTWYDDVLAQTFTPSMTGKLKMIKIYAAKSGLITVYCEIRTTDQNGLPTSTVLASAQPSLGAASEYKIIFNNPPQLQAGVKYAIVIYDDSSEALYRVTWYRGSGDTYSGGQGYSSSDGVTWSDVGGDFYFKVYIDTGSMISSFQVSFQYTITPTYVVAYRGDVGKSLNTFNYTINIYHNVDNNQSWVLAYSEPHVNSTAITSMSYTSPWISLITGSYSQGNHQYYYKIELVVDAFDLTGQRMSKVSYVILSDQFYWMDYMSFDGRLGVVSTNMQYFDYISPVSMVLLILILSGFFVIRRRMMERD